MSCRNWVPQGLDAVKQVPGVTDVSTDREPGGLQANVVIDRTAAARLGVRIQDIDNALNDAFSQRQISTIYTQRNQYRVVLEVDPQVPARSLRPQPHLRRRANGNARCRCRPWRMSSAASRRWWSTTRASSRRSRSPSTSLPNVPDRGRHRRHPARGRRDAHARHASTPTSPATCRPSAVGRRAAAADRWRRWSRSISCSACCTRASPIR